MELKTLIKVEHLAKVFTTKASESKVLTDINFSVNQGDFLMIFGPSGSGKSTLLHSLLGLEEPTVGKVFFQNQELYRLSEDKIADLRKGNVGMIYQQPNWIKAFTVSENIAFALRLIGCPLNEINRRIDEGLKMVGMEAWSSSFPAELSSGQQQKVAFVRAIVTNPVMIIADEPTGNLDFESGQELMQLLAKYNHAGKTVIMVTHDLEYLPFANRAIQMLDGKIIKIVDDPSHKFTDLDHSSKRIML